MPAFPYNQNRKSEALSSNLSCSKLNSKKQVFYLEKFEDYIQISALLKQKQSRLRFWKCGKAEAFN